jgi:hypothetical protein
VTRVARQLTTLIPPASTISVRLLALPDGPALSGAAGGVWALDLGELSYTAPSRRTNIATKRLPHSFVITAEFGVEIQNTAAVAATATLLAFLQASQAHYSIKIDGIALQSGSQPIAAHLHTGLVSRHRLEIEIPTSLTEREARLANVIQFSVVPD